MKVSEKTFAGYCVLCVSSFHVLPFSHTCSENRIFLQCQKNFTHFYYSIDFEQKEVQQHKSALKAGAFRLNMAPTEYFDGNPYKTDKPLPPLRKSVDVSGKQLGPAFRPSNPGKNVSRFRFLYIYVKYKMK